MEVTLAFKGGALQVFDENLKIFGLNVSVLGRASEEIVSMLHYKSLSGAEDPTNTAHELPVRRPARPALCQGEIIDPGYPAIAQAYASKDSLKSPLGMLITELLQLGVRRSNAPEDYSSKSVEPTSRER